MKHLIALSTLLVALNAAAECPSSKPIEKPGIPDGSAANADTMLKAKAAVQAYLANIDDILRCHDLRLTDRSYNELVDREIAVADAYNRELRRYQRRDAMLANN